MRTTLRPILFLGLMNVLRAQITVSPNATESTTLANTKVSSRYRDPLLSRMWPNRTLATNEERIKALAIALRDADRVLNSKRSRKNEQSEKPRTFASPIMAPELRPRSSDRSADPPRRNSRLRSRTTGRYTAPAPILLPPYKSYSPEYDFDNDKTIEPPFGENSLTTTEFPNNSTIGRIRIYEITTADPLKDPKTGDSERSNDFSSVVTKENDLGFSLTTSSKTSFGSSLASTDDHDDYSSPTAVNNQNVHSSYNYEDVTTLEPLRIKLNGNNSFNSPRGSIKYSENGEPNRISRKKDVFSSAESSYNWRRRLIQPANHYKYIDSTRKIGAIPGVPGRDYPVHQQHVHHHLRYPASRFLCPVGAGTHVYLADRASRCQIFYVCYGDQTGVPMMCPNGTLFSEPLQVCDWWFNVVC